jgi:putative membrane protein
MLDLVLAVGHHLLIFGIFGVLFAEFWVLRPGMSNATAARLASMDGWYGGFAAAVVVVGFCRAIFAAKGWVYYSHNAFFWAKIGSFAAIGLLSIRPTIEFIRWRRAGSAPNDAAIRDIQGYVQMELALFALLPIFAAAMARGLGEWSLH